MSYESPITKITDYINRAVTETEEGYLLECVGRVGFKIDKEELRKVLQYDRDQYEKGYADGRRARDAEIVRCKDCKYRIFDPNDDWCGYTGCDINPDGFCEEGERREDG